MTEFWSYLPYYIPFLAAEIVRAVIICHFFVHFNNQKDRPLYYTVFLIAYFMLSIVITVYFAWIGTWGNLLFLLLFLTFMTFVLRISVKAAVTAALIVLTITSLLGNITYALLKIFSEFMTAPYILIVNSVTLVITLLILWAVLRLLYRRFAFRGGQRQSYLLMLWMPLALILVFSEIFSRFLNSSQTNIDPAGRMVFSTFVPVGGVETLAVFLFALVCFGLTFFAYSHFLDMQEREDRHTMLEQQAVWQKNAVQEAVQRSERTAAYRHDLSNHLGVIASLVKGGNSKEAEKYLGTLESAFSELDHGADSGSIVLDALLSDKLNIAKHLGIDVECTVSLPGASIDEYDLCIVLGNILDNAIRACEDVPEGEKHIVISASRKKDFVYIECCNSKGEKTRHGTGWGLKNIRSVVKKYHGEIQIQKNQTEFCILALFSVDSPRFHI